MRSLAVVVLALAIFAACHEEEPVGFEPLTQVPFSPCSPAGGGKWLSDEVAIANEILAEQSHDLEFDHDERAALESEITGVLAQVRVALPVAVGISAPPYGLFQIGLQLTREATARLPAEALGGTAARHLGLNAVDSLSERLGVKEMYLHSNEDAPAATVDLCLDDAVNVNEAVREYTALEDVETAYATTVVGDSPALDMRERDDVWYVVVREAGGDCPAGCTEETLHLLNVTPSRVDTIDEIEVAHDPLFLHIVHLVRRNDSPWPNPSPTPVVVS